MAVVAVTPIQIKSLREQIYDYLRDQLNTGGLRPGAFIDLNELAGRLGVSRTPLRDALLQLEVEGFVTILPRRGIRVNDLTLDDIRHIYEIVGALEASALAIAGSSLGPDAIRRMKEHNQAMARAVENDDFEDFYAHNLAFHDVYLEGCGNTRLAALVRTLKQRLYDWPRPKRLFKDWETSSVGEHAEVVRRLEAGDPRGAADFVREVHWSYDVQERFVLRSEYAKADAKADSRIDPKPGAEGR
jgi:DNA-binding GntR family transcriptional regulator